MKIPKLPHRLYALSLMPAIEEIMGDGLVTLLLDHDGRESGHFELEIVEGSYAASRVERLRALAPDIKFVFRFLVIKSGWVGGGCFWAQPQTDDRRGERVRVR
jgi:hypothetical protein